MYALTLLALTMSITACKKDDTTVEEIMVTEPDPTDEIVPDPVDSNTIEETILNPDTVSTNLLIEGATKKEGDAPEPKGELSFLLSDENSNSAFLKNGFEIIFTKPDNYAGAYLQISNSNDTFADEYWDIPLNAGKKSSVSSINKKNSFISKQVSNKSNSYDDAITINFEDTIPPGTFCYNLCIYDTNGNISAPIEVCVEIEAWGGNPNLVGNWEFTKVIALGETYELGDPYDCSESNITCKDGSKITIKEAYCYTHNSYVINLNSDNTFSLVLDGTLTSLDYPNSLEACSPIFDNRNEIYQSKGNWAYDEEEKKLTLIEFEYESNTEGAGIEENGEVFFNGAISLTTSELTLTEPYSNGIIIGEENLFFSKKIN